MVDYVSNPRAAARARRREATEVASFVRRLDWILIGSVAALVGYGLWAIAGITHHDVAGDQGYYLTRQSVYVVIGVLGLLVATLIDPDLYRTRWRVIFGGTSFLIAIVLLAGPIRGSKRWLDLGSERSGLLPTPDWRKKTYTKKTDPGHWQIDSLWKPGYSIQLAIGQKDLLVTPMQMARFYAIIANGGKLVTPHILLDVEQPSSNHSPGRVVPTTPPPAPEPTNVDAQALAVVREGLFQATHATLGTSTSIFGSFPVSISGKTGTAEKKIDPGDGIFRTFNQSWWCGYGPSDSPDLVVCALIENGGFGAEAAAPAALKVFQQFFHASAIGAPQTGAAP